MCREIRIRRIKRIMDRISDSKPQLEIDGLNRFGSEDSKSTIFRVRLYEALEASIFGVSKNPGYPVKVEVQENGFLCLHFLTDHSTVS